MNNKLYYWAENLEDYSTDIEECYGQVIEIKKRIFVLVRIMQVRIGFKILSLTTLNPIIIKSIYL